MMPVLANAGPPPDIASVYRETAPRLKRLAQLKLGTAEEADEVVQEAFASFLARGGGSGIDCVPGYLLRIVSNLATDRLRRRHLWREREQVAAWDLEIGCPEPSAERIVGARQQVERVRSMLDDLPERCREAFIKHRFEAREYADIASEMEISESMVRKYVLRAMRHCLARMDAGDWRGD